MLVYFEFENCDKLTHFRFNFDACQMRSFFEFVHLTHQISLCLSDITFTMTHYSLKMQEMLNTYNTDAKTDWQMDPTAERRYFHLLLANGIIKYYFKCYHIKDGWS